ncbi:MAG: BON domain-containing protein [bacterium]
MSPLRFRDEESSSTNTVLGVLVGAVAGFAVGMLVAQRVGGFSGLASKLRRRSGASAAEAATGRFAADDDTDDADDADEFEDIEEDELESEDYDETLEERVLEAFRNDPILAERAVDIGSIGEGVIELAGWVENEDESHHAVTIARGVPDVDTVVNRIAIGDEERRFEENARKVRDGDPSLTEAHWEGHSVGTGRRRQGTSTETDRHADPKVKLGERWQGTDDAIRNAADDTAGIAERRSRAKKSVRGERLDGGSSVSPAGVPKGDHVVHPIEGDTLARVDTTMDAGSAQTERQDRF